MDNELLQWQAHTDELVATLLEDGSNEEVLHTIEHHFASDNFECLERAAVSAFKLGFDVEEPEEAELEDGSKIFAFDIVTQQPLDAKIIFVEVEKMFALAQQANIDYDGWGTYFEE